jgi:hypothetical protein
LLSSSISIGISFPSILTVFLPSLLARFNPQLTKLKGMVTFTCGFSPLVTRIFKNLFFFVDRGVVSSSSLVSLKASL